MYYNNYTPYAADYQNRYIDITNSMQYEKMNCNFPPHNPINSEPLVPQPMILTVKKEPLDNFAVVPGTESLVEVGNKSSSSQVDPIKSQKIKELRAVVVDKALRTCLTCGKILASITSLHTHMKSHSSNKPYDCSDCGATFTRKYYLEVHQRSHTGEKPFQCKVCHKCFSQKSSLNTHKRIHTGEKPYRCQKCDKAFSAQSYLSSHQWTHADKNDNGDYQCRTCTTSFSSRAQLVQHMKVHTNVVEFTCELCYRGFSKESYLIRHKLLMHENGRRHGRHKGHH